MASVTDGPGIVVLGAADRAAAVTAIKAQLRVAVDDDAALIAAFAESALGLAEQFTGQALIARGMTMVLPAASGWQRLPAAPVRAITAVTAGTPVAALASKAYAVDIDADGGGWVRVMAAPGPVTVTFTAGLATGWDALPPALRQGVTLLAAHLYDDRVGAKAPPAAVAALWRPFRTMRLVPAGHA